MSNEQKKRTFIGEVISDKMDKTVVVNLSRSYKHKEFHKTIRTLKKYKIHDENNSAKVGDVIEFYEGRPVSKTKCMYLARIVKSNAVNE
jgi:small subunit ribosomal protein S17